MEHVSCEPLPNVSAEQPGGRTTVGGIPAGRLTPEQRKLLQTASELLLRRAEEGKHHIASALSTVSGEVFVGLHLSASIGVGSVCAEEVAIGASQLAHDNEIASIVSVRRVFSEKGDLEIVPPCGRCRQLILQYGAAASVVLQVHGSPRAVKVEDILPFPFLRRTRRGEFQR